MNKLNLTLAAAVAAGLLAGCATTKQDRFALVDADSNGQLSRDEMSDALVVTVFEARDANKDGKMTATEWLVEDDKGRSKQFHLRDTNKDNVVTLEEAKAYGRKKGMANETLKKADKNGDNALSRAEATAYYGSTEGPVR